MEINNVSVFGLGASIIASGYPMSTEIKNHDEILCRGDIEGSIKDIERSKKLGKAKAGSGHDCYLKGVIVQADVTAPQYWWLQFGRYHFADIISSQSKMHRITKMDIEAQCNEYVAWHNTHYLKDLITLYNDFNPNFMQTFEIRGKSFPYTKENLYKAIIANTPMGLNLTARITTNYLQLKTMYYQRKNHKLDEWSEVFCNWVEELPMFKELVLGE